MSRHSFPEYGFNWACSASDFLGKLFYRRLFPFVDAWRCLVHQERIALYGKLITVYPVRTRNYNSLIMYFVKRGPEKYQIGLGFLFGNGVGSHRCMISLFTFFVLSQLQFLIFYSNCLLCNLAK